ncbi:LuxR C-terminal-related transcriptional regulator [Phosphitispora sp. TUW77]|uniref:response regulator transcription factor n=1 Tax=Phosphitispora sp. TUW77 TaxID=3152361 RepID=UPI003AB1B60D
MKLKLVVIDDHPLVRQGLILALSSEPSFEIVGEAGTVRQSFEVLQRTRPDIAIVDLRLGDSSGLAIIEEAKLKQSGCKFIILTSSGSERDFLYAEQLEVSGYILKEALPDEIIHAVRIIGQGRKYYDPRILEIKMKGETVLNEELTPREREVLAALGRGLSNRDIASQIYVSENTVKKHVSQILAKLNLGDRTQAALYAYSKGMVRDCL